MAKDKLSVLDRHDTIYLTARPQLKLVLKNCEKPFECCVFIRDKNSRLYYETYTNTCYNILRCLEIHCTSLMYMRCLMPHLVLTYCMIPGVKTEKPKNCRCTSCTKLKN